MSCPIRCAAEVRQWVVVAVLRIQGKLKHVRRLPGIRDKESCTQYYSRCQRGFLTKAFSFVGKMFQQSNSS